ncbi:zinc finger CCHC domain-containing protein 17-like [Mytilus californianus]|uniref:zinc finger CCHC domain-containing protein 17-like n=1 Tax=Mytilus californianus TaxID=6549 RepID=UPI00224849ED|nr:zinc finger CCHC domain-containing protein 17-like [Mytilus californianus]
MSSPKHKERRSSSGPIDLPALYSVFYGEVAALQPYGAFIKIPGYRKQGLVHKSQMSKARVEDPSEMLAVGEMVYCKVVSVEGDKIGLSMKVINQTTGKDEDSANVQLSLDERKNRKGFRMERAKIELGAVLDTTCKKCGGHGHLAQDCFHAKGGKTYELIPEDELVSPSKETDTSSSRKRKKKEKKAKKSKKHRHSDSLSDDETDKSHKKKHKKHKHHHHKHEKKSRHDNSSSSCDG